MNLGSDLRHDPKEQALFDLADRISQGCREIERTNRDALAIAIKVGADLIEAKRRLPHGKFGPWVLKHCDIRTRTAQTYIQLAENVETLNAQSSAHLNSIDAALKFLRAHKGTKKTRQSAASAATQNQNRATAGLEKKVLDAVKMALSLVGSGNGNDYEIVSAVRGVNRLLKSNSLDLHDIEIRIAAKPARRRAA